MLFATLVVSACATKIPNVRVYKPIPFKCATANGVVYECPEAVFVDSLTHKEGWLNTKQTAEKIPYWIALDPEGWTSIKNQWYEACRYARDKNGCTAQVESVDKLIRLLDDIARQMIKPKR